MNKPLHSDARGVIFCVFQRCLAECHAKKLLPDLEDVYKRTAEMTASFSWKIEKYARMTSVWVKELKPNIHVMIHFDQMFILSDNTILDNFNLKHIKKGYLKHKTLIIAHKYEDSVRRVKMLLSCSVEEVKDLISLLQLHCLIEDVLDPNNSAEASHVYETFQDKFKTEMERQRSNITIGALFPQNFKFDEFLRICILDADFPYFVDQVEKNLDPFLQ